MRCQGGQDCAENVGNSREGSPTQFREADRAGGSVEGHYQPSMTPCRSGDGTELRKDHSARVRGEGAFLAAVRAKKEGGASAPPLRIYACTWQ